MLTLLHHLEALVAYPSITPEDAGCQTYIHQYLQDLGYSCQILSKNKVSNLYAEYGHGGKRLVFAGHTDVVTPGPLENWDTPPFQLTQKHERLYGRGVADMKGAVAAMLSLAKAWAENPGLGTLGFLLTSGEEGDDFLDGTPYVMQQLQQQGTHIDYVIVGEPSSQVFSGDTIKVGRRGSLSGKASIKGIQGHVAYPQHALNAIHHALPFLTALSQKHWDDGCEHFPPSTLQMTNIDIPNPAKNVIPGILTFEFNLRYNPQQTSEGIKEMILGLAREHQIDLHCDWQLSGEPFLTPPGPLTQTVKTCIKDLTHCSPECSTSGGTSDARFIAPYGIEVIELGLPNPTIHQANENIAHQDLTQLYALYLHITDALLR